MVCFGFEADRVHHDELLADGLLPVQHASEQHSGFGHDAAPGFDADLEIAGCDAFDERLSHRPTIVDARGGEDA